MTEGCATEQLAAVDWTACQPSASAGSQQHHSPRRSSQWHHSVSRHHGPRRRSPGLLSVNKQRNFQTFRMYKICIFSEAYLNLIKGHIKDKWLIVIRIQSLLFNTCLLFLPLPLIQSQLHFYIRIYKREIKEKSWSPVLYDVTWLIATVWLSDLIMWILDYSKKFNFIHKRIAMNYRQRAVLHLKFSQFSNSLIFWYPRSVRSNDPKLL